MNQQHWAVYGVMSKWVGEDTGPWYVAVVNPNCLIRAEDELGRLGYRTFTPKIRKWISHARVKKVVDRPILGRYLFVEVGEAPLKGARADLTEQMTGRRPCQSFDSVRRCNGVESLVGIAGEPKAVPAVAVERLIGRQLSGEWNMVDEGEFPDGNGGRRVNPEIPIGARVRIVEGEFESLLATIVGRKRGKIGVKLADRNVTRQMYPMMVRPAA